MSLIAPLLVQIALTLGLVGLVGVSRIGALRRREVPLAAVAASNDAWPEPVRLISNNYANQFETPVLFYVLVLLALHLGATGPGLVVTAWIFVASRLAHSLIHLNGNNVRLRFNAFAVGTLALLAMAVQLGFTAFS